MAKRRMLFLALAVAVAAIFITQLQRSGPLGRGKGLEPGADTEGRVPIDPQGVREEPPLRIQAKRRDQELEIEMTSRTALSQMNVVVQRFETGSAAQAAAADTAWTGGMDAGADRQLKFPLPPGTPNTVRFVISARGTDATGGRIAATTVIQP